MNKILILLLILTPAISYSSDSLVEWISSKDPKYDLLVVTINECKTTFKVRKDNINLFEKDENAQEQLTKLAIERSFTGCK